jgi:hypothetical protein
VRIWTCDVCGFSGPWRDGKSAIYGSILTEEEGIPQFYICSLACQNTVKDNIDTEWRIKVEAAKLPERQMKVFRKAFRSKGNREDLHL